jgi:hypothetical protein
MRADMAKVIVERPRHQGHAGRKPKGYHKRLQRFGEDGPPAREGIKARWQGGSKRFNEHLGPLRRYLDKQVGRPWNKVFSEICDHINRDSAVQDHVRDHVAGYVTTHVVLIEGVPCNGEGGRGYGRPLHEFPYRPWYVCPRTGLLRRVKRVRRPRRRDSVTAHPPTFIRVSETLQCRFLDGAWHLITLAPLPQPYAHRRPVTAVDVLLGIPADHLTGEKAREHYGSEVYATDRRRLARRELAQYPIPDRWWDYGR